MSADITRAFAALIEELTQFSSGIEARRSVIHRHIEQARASSGLHEWELFLAREEERIAAAGDVMLVQAAIASGGQHPVALAAEEWLGTTEWRKPYFRMLNRPAGAGPAEPVEVYPHDAGPLALHPDGVRFVSAVGNEIWVWSRQRQGVLRKIKTGLRGAIYRLAIHPDGQRVLAGALSEMDSADGRVIAVHIDSGRRITAYQPKRPATTGFFALSNDGRWIAAGGTHSLNVWEVATQAKTKRASWAVDGSYGSVGIHPNNEWVVAWRAPDRFDEAGHIEIRAIADGSLVRSLPVLSREAVENGIVAPVFLDNGRRSLWSFDSSHFAYIDLESGAVLGWCAAHDRVITALSVSADEKLVLTASQDKSFRIWDLATLTCLHTNRAEGDFVWAAQFVDDTHVLVSSGRRTSMWPVTIGVDQEQDSHENVTACTVALAGQRVLTVHDGQTIRVWDTTSGKCLFETEVPAELESPAAFVSGDDTQFVIVARSSDQAGWIDARQPVTIEFRPKEAAMLLEAVGGHLMRTGRPPSAETLAQLPWQIALNANWQGDTAYRLQDGTVQAVPIPKAPRGPFHSTLAHSGKSGYVVTAVQVFSSDDLDIRVVPIDRPDSPRVTVVPAVRRKDASSDGSRFVVQRPGTEFVYIVSMAGYVYRFPFAAEQPQIETVVDLRPFDAIEAIAFEASGSRFVMDTFGDLSLRDSDTGARLGVLRYTHQATENARHLLRWVTEDVVLVLRGTRFFLLRLENLD